MRDYYTLKINAPGGILSPGTFRHVLALAQEAGVREVRFGSRQQVLMTVHYEQLPALEKSLKTTLIAYEINTDQQPNIISSYCGEDVFRSGDWLRESEYHTILDQLTFQPRLKINLSDAGQSFTPFFTGHLNFIASPEPHFWYVYLRKPKTNAIFRWPELLYTNEIGRFAQQMEERLTADADASFLYETMDTSFITRPATQEVELPEFSLPYYEGFNRYGSRSWLGLYSREDWFSIAFLREVCELCLRTRIGEICTTPWKSLIIKGIEEKDRSNWSYLLGKYAINVRHAAHELAWQTEDHTTEGTTLKNYIRRHFEKLDIRTFGLCFGIQTRPKSEVFGSVLIRKRPWLQWGLFSLGTVYDLYVTEQYNPNSRQLIRVEKGLFKMHVPHQVERICRQYTSKRHQPSPIALTLAEDRPAVPDPTVYECPHCLTHYDERYGDARQNIAAGTLFQALPAHYVCPTCEAPKTELQAITKLVSA